MIIAATSSLTSITVEKAAAHGPKVASAFVQRPRRRRHPHPRRPRPHQRYRHRRHFRQERLLCLPRHPSRLCNPGAYELPAASCCVIAAIARRAHRSRRSSIARSPQGPWATGSRAVVHHTYTTTLFLVLLFRAAPSATHLRLRYSRPTASSQLTRRWVTKLATFCPVASSISGLTAAAAQ